MISCVIVTHRMLDEGVDLRSLSKAYLAACRLDVEAFKPGNVSVHSAGHAMTAEDFIISAEASAQALFKPDTGLGRRIFDAVEATHNRVACNTNLGIILLCAPLVHCVLRCEGRQTLRAKLGAILQTTTVEDAQWAYQAIRMAAPGGLGHSDTQDVNNAPTVSLLATMRIAAHRDRIAYQYVTGYTDLFDTALPWLCEDEQRFNDKHWAVTALYLRLLAQFPDSHIERKGGEMRAERVRKRATVLRDCLLTSDSPEKTLLQLQGVDAKFKEDGINPGTTADLTVATLVIKSFTTFLRSSIPIGAR